MYEQMSIFGETDLEFAERTAIKLLKEFEPIALQRCGCVLCPMCSDKERQKEAELFPKYADNFRRLCDKIAEKRADGISGEALFQAYMGVDGWKKHKGK